MFKNFVSRLLVAATALFLAACQTAPIKEVTTIGEPAKKLEEVNPASARFLKFREGGKDLNDPVRVTMITDWCELNPDGASCKWRTNFNAMTFDPFARAFLINFTGGGFVGLTQLAGTTYAAKKAASNCPENSFCGGTMVQVEGATAVSGSQSTAAAESGQTQQTIIGPVAPPKKP